MAAAPWTCRGLDNAPGTRRPGPWPPPSRRPPSLSPMQPAAEARGTAPEGSCLPGAHGVRAPHARASDARRPREGLPEPRSSSALRAAVPSVGTSPAQPGFGRAQAAGAPLRSRSPGGHAGRGAGALQRRPRCPRPAGGRALREGPRDDSVRRRRRLCPSPGRALTPTLSVRRERGFYPRARRKPCWTLLCAFPQVREISPSATDLRQTRAERRAAEARAPERPLTHVTSASLSGTDPKRSSPRARRPPTARPPAPRFKVGG